MTNVMTYKIYKNYKKYSYGSGFVCHDITVS